MSAVEKKEDCKKFQSIKSRERVRDTGEVFTQEREVKAMCDLCEPLISQIDKTVLEPTCGTGNFLVEILRRKLKNTNKDLYKVLIALSNIYGIDIATDNIEEARSRMRGVIFDYLSNIETGKDFLLAMDTILKYNIVFGDSMTTRGKKKINLIKWSPDGLGGFDMQRVNFLDIEKQRENSASAGNMAEIPEKIKLALYGPPPDPDSTKKAKPKPKPKSEQQMTLI